MDMEDVFELIRAERRRQDAKWGPENRLQTGNPDKRMTILTEEHGEVAKAVNEHDREGMLKELVQVAAVAVAWLERPHEAPEFFRASGECICGDCGRYYRAHPLFEGALFQGEPWLNVLCDGSLVKL